MEVETARSLASHADSSSLNDRQSYSIKGKKNSLMHKTTGEKIVMNIQTNLESMNNKAGVQTSRNQTDSFMDKLRRRFFDDQEVGTTPSVFSAVDQNGPQAGRKYAYSTRNRSIQHPALKAGSITEALQLGISQRR